jgi:hypothetical protein
MREHGCGLPDSLNSARKKSHALFPRITSSGCLYDPICSSIPSRSQLSQPSTILPFTIRAMVIPEMRIRLPDGGKPNPLPVCGPVATHRTATMSPIAKISSTTSSLSGNALRIRSANLTNPSGPWISSSGPACPHNRTHSDGSGQQTGITKNVASGGNSGDVPVCPLRFSG